MKDLEKMLMGAEKNQSSEMDPKSMQAKLEVLQEILGMAQELMGSKLKGDMDSMKKVTVAAPDAESLKQGLEQAEEVVESPMMEKMEEMSGEDLDQDMEMGEPEEHKQKVLEASEDEQEEKPKKKKLFSMLDDE